MRQGTITQNVMFGVVTTLLIAFIIIETIYEKEMMDFSNEFTKRIQELNVFYLMWFFSYVVMFGLPGIYLFYAIFFSHDKVMVVFDIIYICSQLWVSNLFKFAYSQPRPYMVSGGPLPLDKDVDYGMPSGHSWNIVIFSMLVYDKFFSRENMIYRSRMKAREFHFEAESKAKANQEGGDNTHTEFVDDVQKSYYGKKNTKEEHMVSESINPDDISEKKTSVVD